MKSLTLSIDVDLEEVLWQCSSKDIEYIKNYLVENGHISKLQANSSSKTKPNIFDESWNEALIKLNENRHVLNNYQIQYIENISKTIP